MAKYNPYIPEAEALCDVAADSERSGDSLQAFELFEQVLEMHPLYPRALHAKGVLLHKQNDSDQAIDTLKICLEANPLYLDALNSLGNIYRSQYNYDESLLCYNKIIATNPEYFLAYFNIGEVKQKEQDDTSALIYFRKAIKYNKKFVPAYTSIVRIYKKRSKLLDAERLCRKILKLEPNNVEAQFMIGAVRAEYGEIPEAIDWMRKVKNSESFGLAAHASIIYYLNLLPDIQQEEIYSESRLFEERYAVCYHHLQRPHVNSPDPERKLRIGFVSGDIKLHPVARHLRPLIQNLDRKKFELYAYNNYNIHDDVTEEFKTLFCFWRNIHELPDEKVVEMVRLDTIDILFDLAGFTGFSRLMMFARKPAPIQISWIGYFNTTGFSTMDYIISDDVTVRQNEEVWFSEKLLKLPQSRFCYDPRPDILPEVAQTPAVSRGYVTFGAFNKVNKLNEVVVETWAAILQAIPDSRLVLKWPAYKDKTARKIVSDRFGKFGISSDRLEFRKESGYRLLLQEYTNDIDIVLDTFPHSGGATSCDALVMGVPVLTFSGTIPISRQTHGFLKLMGLEQSLVCHSLQEYVAKAIHLAQDIGVITAIRGSLRERFLASYLCDGVSFTHDFEAAVRSIWRKWANGKSSSQVLQQKPLNIDEVYNEGINLMELGAYKESVPYFSKVIEMSPRNDKAMNNLAICLWELGELEEAEKVLRRARRVNRSNDDVCCNLSGILILKNRHAALYYSKKGIELNPNNIDLHINHIFALLELSRSSEALGTIHYVLDNYPSSSKLMTIQANCYGARGNIVYAIRCLKNALELDSANADAHSNLLYAMNNSDLFTQQQMYDEAVAWDKSHSVVVNDEPISSSALIRKTKLRVGLVSADFRQHPGGMLFYPFIEHYDKNCLEIFCYYNHHKYDDMTNAIKTKCDVWREVISLSNQELYEVVKNDNIDILIDMNGHTDKNRLKFFSMNPCQIQATWLGYFNTTGVSAINYFISDEFTSPNWMQQWFSEKIIRLPHSRFCYSAPEYSPLVSLSPAEWKGFITFGSFNNCSKLSDTTIKMWASVLKKVSGSRLMLKWKAYRDKGVRDWIVGRFEQEGICKNRLLIRKDIHHAQMLADYSSVDIVLDTYPFNGGMTSVEALWMGVPIVTLAGSTPASRQTGSFLRLLGLNDLITENQEQFVTTAVALAKDRERLYEIRSGLRLKMKESPLMNGSLFAQNMQKMFEQMVSERGGVSE